MILKEYQLAARSTAIYLGIPASKMIYPALGIVGECGEVADKVKKLIRDNGWDMTEDRKNAIAKELGDCCWYLANICCDTGLDFDMMYIMRGSSISQKIKPMILPRIVLHMNRHAICVANSLEKWCYDYDGRIGEQCRFKDIPIHMSNIISCIEEIAVRCGFTLGQICKMNIDNLAGRKQRGTLHGDGDNR